MPARHAHKAHCNNIDSAERTFRSTAIGPAQDRPVRESTPFHSGKASIILQTDVGDEGATCLDLGRAGNLAALDADAELRKPKRGKERLPWLGAASCAATGAASASSNATTTERSDGFMTSPRL